jgi:sec-independent protein translocase protein TatB
MFDFGIGTSELFIIAIIALLVVGPKDLPKLLRTIGQFTTKIRGMAREFQGHLNEAMRETGVEDVKKEVNKMTNFTVTATDFSKEAADIKKAVESAAPKLDEPETPRSDSIAEPEKPEPAKAQGATRPEKAVETVGS